MNELQLQNLIIDAVRKEGKGFAHKMSNRFLVGVPDVLTQVPGFPTWLWEVKIRNAPSDPMKPFKLDVTPLQMKWLNDYATAGGNAGVVSGLRTKNELLIHAVSVQHLVFDEAERVVLYAAGHEPLYRGERLQGILAVLRKVMD